MNDLLKPRSLNDITNEYIKLKVENTKLKEENNKLKEENVMLKNTKLECDVYDVSYLLIDTIDSNEILLKYVKWTEYNMIHQGYMINDIRLLISYNNKTFSELLQEIVKTNNNYLFKFLINN